MNVQSRCPSTQNLTLVLKHTSFDKSCVSNNDSGFIVYNPAFRFSGASPVARIATLKIARACPACSITAISPPERFERVFWRGCPLILQEASANMPPPKHVSKQVELNASHGTTSFSHFDRSISNCQPRWALNSARTWIRLSNSYKLPTYACLVSKAAVFHGALHATEGLAVFTPLGRGFLPWASNIALHTGGTPHSMGGPPTHSSWHVVSLTWHMILLIRTPSYLFQSLWGKTPGNELHQPFGLTGQPCCRKWWQDRFLLLVRQNGNTI